MKTTIDLLNNIDFCVNMGINPIQIGPFGGSKKLGGGRVALRVPLHNSR